VIFKVFIALILRFGPFGRANCLSRRLTTNAPGGQRKEARTPRRAANAIFAGVAAIRCFRQNPAIGRPAGLPLWRRRGRRLIGAILGWQPDGMFIQIN
jgi:hypothetical protein